MKLSTLCAVALISTTAPVFSATSPSDARASTVASELPPLMVTELTPPFSTTGNSLTVVALDDSNRSLVNIDNGQETAAYIATETSWTKVADYRAVTFETVGGILRRDVIVGNRGSDIGGYGAFLTMEGVEQVIHHRNDSSESTLIADVNRSGTVVGQYMKGNFWHAFSITPTDEDHDGVPDTWFKDEQPQDHINDIFADLGEARPGASVATAVNDNGTIVGIYQSSNGDWLPFGTSGSSGARPNDISNNNLVVGLDTITQRALLFPSTILSTEGNFGNTSALSVNEQGQIVGISGNYAGFYYDSEHGIGAINARIPLASDHRSYSPTEINDRGTIAANASNHAFLLVPVDSCRPAATLDAGCNADLSLSLDDAPDPVTSSQDLTYGISIFNNGPSNATGVTVTDHLPTGVIFVSAVASQGQCVATVLVTCSLATLDSGASATVYIVVKPLRSAVGTTLSNAAQVTAAQPDPNMINNASTVATLENRCSPAELSGPAWAAQFPTSIKVDDLADGFEADVVNFINAMTNGGISVEILATLRPRQRAYLMHYSYLIAHDNFQATAVPDFVPEPGEAVVGICWVHRDPNGVSNQVASRAAAEQLKNALGVDPTLETAPALGSRHTVGLAIDMKTTWNQSSVTVTDGNGQPVIIHSHPHNGLNQRLIDIGETYGVIHFKPAPNDRNHWSSDGH